MGTSAGGHTCGKPVRMHLQAALAPTIHQYRPSRACRGGERALAGAARLERTVREESLKRPSHWAHVSFSIPQVTAVVLWAPATLPGKPAERPGGIDVGDRGRQEGRQGGRGPRGGDEQTEKGSRRASVNCWRAWALPWASVSSSTNVPASR